MAKRRRTGGGTAGQVHAMEKGPEAEQEARAEPAEQEARAGSAEQGV